jgi:hypothetical protein
MRLPNGLGYLTPNSRAGLPTFSAIAALTFLEVARMAASLERRIEAMEAQVMQGSGYTIIAVQVVSPGDLEPESSFCKIDGVTHTQQRGEPPADFENRMCLVAEELNQQRGWPIRIICGWNDLTI